MAASTENAGGRAVVERVVPHEACRVLGCVRGARQTLEPVSLSLSDGERLNRPRRGRVGVSKEHSNKAPRHTCSGERRGLACQFPGASERWCSTAARARRAAAGRKETRRQRGPAVKKHDGDRGVSSKWRGSTCRLLLRLPSTTGDTHLTD